MVENQLDDNNLLIFALIIHHDAWIPLSIEMLGGLGADCAIGGLQREVRHGDWAHDDGHQRA